MNIYISEIHASPSASLIYQYTVTLLFFDTITMSPWAYEAHTPPFCVGTWGGLVELLESEARGF